MIISRTPLRMVFFGGGTDLAEWCRGHGGAVLGATIAKYCYLSCRRMPPLFTHRLRVVWSRTENCQDVSEVQHPAVREVLRHLGIGQGLSIHHDSDLPAHAGMGASSAFTVGLLHALYGLRGTLPSTRQLADEARDIEQVRLEEFVGAADHVLVAHGGMNLVTCEPGGDVRVKPVTVARARVRELNARLMLFCVGRRRATSDVFQAYLDASRRRASELADLGAMVEAGAAVLSGSGDLAGFGRLLAESWRVKRRLGAAISTPEIDAAYEQAVRAGAVGGTLLGPGGGGFLLLDVPPERRPSVRTMLRSIPHVPFEFEHAGTEIIFADPEADAGSDGPDPDDSFVRGRQFPEGF